MKLEKVEKILKMAQLLNENPDISANELASLLNTNLRNVYRYIKQFQKDRIPLGLKEKSRHTHLLYDEIDYLRLALNQAELSLTHKSIKATLQNPKALNEDERQILEGVEAMISKALWATSVASPASIDFLFKPITGKYDGEVTLGFVGSFERQIPLYLVTSITTNFLGLIFSSLFTYPKGKPEELLVQSWRVSDDLLTWNFELKEGVKFHNGKELTAEDVEFSYQSLLDPEYSPTLASIYSFVESFEAISKYKFQIKLKNPNIALLEMLGIPILPKEIVQRYRRLKNSDPEALLIGSGPFKFDSFPQADTLILKANKDYFEEGYPQLEKVILKAYPTSRDLFNAATSGGVDVVIFGLGISEFEQLGKTIPFQVYPLEMHAYYALLFNMKDQTFSDLRVRQAISHAIDRESLIRRQLRGYGKVSNGPLPPSSWANNQNLQPVKYDLEFAKSLLVESGWKEKEDHWQKRSQKLEMEITLARELPDLMRLIIGLKSQLSKLKIRVNIRYINSSEITPNGFSSLLLLINSGGDPDKLWRFWHSSSKLNLALYQNPEVDELLDWGRNVVSISKRRAIYARVQELIAADHPAAFLGTSVSILGSNCLLQNADEFLILSSLFSSIKRWTIERSVREG